MQVKMRGITQYSLIVCVEKFKWTNFFTKQLQMHCQQPTDIRVLSGAAELHLPSELKTQRRGTMYWSLSKMTKERKKIILKRENNNDSCYHKTGSNAQFRGN